MADILNYEQIPFGMGSNENYDEFIAQGYKIKPYFVEVHYNGNGDLLEVVIIDVIKKFLEEYGD